MSNRDMMIRRRLAGLSEYPGDPRGQVTNTVREQGQGRGPLWSPIIDPNNPKDNNWMRELFRTFEEMGILKPHEIQSFLEGSLGAALVATVPQIIATFTMPENSDGYLDFVWVDVAPPGSAGIVSWSLQINGAIHPNFNNIVIPALNQFIPFDVPLQRSQKIDLVAVSTGAPSVSGMVKGWSRLIPDTP